MWLTNIKGIGIRTIRALLDYYNDPEKIYSAPEDELKFVTSLSDAKLDIVRKSKDLEKAKSILERCNKLNIKVLTMNSPSYPGEVVIGVFTRHQAPGI